MKKYRMKPVVVEAMQFTDENSFEEIVEWVGDDNLSDGTSLNEGVIEFTTPDWNHLARVGDWIVKDAKGGFCLYKPDIFEATYDEVSP